MNVIGELKKAMLELIANSSPTPTPTGRVYADITNSLAAIPRFYNGSSWMPFLLGQATPLVTQNSGKTVTVNWATGLFQQVILTDFCVINFSNPQAGQTHTLLVTQTAPTATSKLYGYRLNMTDQDSRRLPYQPVGQLPSGENAVHAWFYATGVKTGYATVNAFVGTPVGMASGLVSADVSPDGKSVIGAGGTTPFSTGYLLYDVQASMQAVTAYKDVVASAATVAVPTDIRYSPDGRTIFSSNGTTPFIQGFYVDRGKPTGSAIANPGTLPAGAAGCVGVHPLGTFVGVGHATTPFMSVYPFAGDRYGTKLTNPITLPPSQVASMDFSPQGDYLAVATLTTPFLSVYAFDPSAGTSALGGALSIPGTLPASGPSSASANPQAVAWRPQGDFIAMGMSASPSLYVCPFNRATATFGTPLTQNFIGSAITAVRWTPDGNYLLCGTGTTPFIYCLDISSGALVNVTFDGGAAAAAITAFAVAPNGEYVFACSSGGNGFYQFTLPSKARNYLRIND